MYFIIKLSNCRIFQLSHCHIIFILLHLHFPFFKSIHLFGDSFFFALFVFVKLQAFFHFVPGCGAAAFLGFVVKAYAFQETGAVVVKPVQPLQDGVNAYTLVSGPVLALQRIVKHKHQLADAQFGLRWRAA